MPADMLALLFMALGIALSTLGWHLYQIGHPSAAGLTFTAATAAFLFMARDAK